MPTSGDMRGGSDDESSDGLDEFEESLDENQRRPPQRNHAVQNRHYDEEYEVSQDLSVAESFDGRDKRPVQQPNPKERKLVNEMYDEAVEVSQSLDQGAFSAAPSKPLFAMNKEEKGSSRIDAMDAKDARPTQQPGMRKDEMTRSQTINNQAFDEALEFSQSGSDESVETTAKGKPPSKTAQAPATTTFLQQQSQSHKAPPQSLASAPSIQMQQQRQQQQQQQQQQREEKKFSESKEEEEESQEEGDHEESYDNIEGAYNAKDYASLNVTSDVRDLFQYIDRFKPQEVELDTPLKCFIPEYIPAIGELDPFLKVPRPDNKEDGNGLKCLDEPASHQSDPTVLELQLRAKSKKLQYGDVVVRSIENADKNPQKIDKWIQDINDLHRSKPPPQVNYKKNMPDIDKLMEAWPEEFEALLAATPLPSPDLDLSLGEYSKILCSLLDIPVYDNPIESLHLLFSLFIEFKNNPHFQSRLADGQADAKDFNDRGNGSKYGGADVLELEHSDYK